MSGKSKKAKRGKKLSASKKMEPTKPLTIYMKWTGTQ